MNAAAPTVDPQPAGAWRTIVRPALTLFIALSVITGIAYPLLVTAIAQVAFPDAANGSLIEREGRIVGSRLIGQSFTDPKYFWSRPSATGPMAYNAAASSGSNLGAAHPDLAGAVESRIAALRAADPGNAAPVPIDLVTTSASGLDPHISRAAADYQVARVARVRGLSEAQVRELVASLAQMPTLGFLGEARVNVVELNLALDAGSKR
jgi:potassium-transporting ATPase KdpC subunit